MIKFDQLTQDQQEGVENAQLLDVRRKSDHPDLSLAIARVWELIKTHRRSKGGQVRKEARQKRILEAILLDLWVASEIIGNSFRSVSRNRNDYVQGTRNRKIHWKYDLFVNLVDDLDALNLIVQVAGFKDRESGNGRRTRIAAKPELIDLLKDCSLPRIKRASDLEEEEIIVLKNVKKEKVDYKDTPFTRKWRESLQAYNTLVDSATITADVNYKALAASQRYIDPTNKHLHRVFNNESWMQGGRFYGGFWQQLSGDERKTIKINGNSTVELDFKCHHARILYIVAEQPIPEEDLYLIEGIDRQDVKDAFLVLFNCDSREQALKTMRSEKHIKNSEKVLQAIEKRHSAISSFLYGYKPIIQLSEREGGKPGAFLQWLDSVITDSILEVMTKAKIICLPVHDSYIVEEKNKESLYWLMNKYYQYYLKQPPKITKQ